MLFHQIFININISIIFVLSTKTSFEALLKNNGTANMSKSFAWNLYILNR